MTDIMPKVCKNPFSILLVPSTVYTCIHIYIYIMYYVHATAVLLCLHMYYVEYVHVHQCFLFMCPSFCHELWLSVSLSIYD